MFTIWTNGRATVYKCRFLEEIINNNQWIKINCKSRSKKRLISFWRSSIKQVRTSWHSCKWWATAYPTLLQNRNWHASCLSIKCSTKNWSPFKGTNHPDTIVFGWPGWRGFIMRKILLAWTEGGTCFSKWNMWRTWLLGWKILDSANRIFRSKLMVSPFTHSRCRYTPNEKNQPSRPRF